MKKAQTDTSVPSSALSSASSAPASPVLPSITSSCHSFQPQPGIFTDRGSVTSTVPVALPSSAGAPTLAAPSAAAITSDKDGSCLPSHVHGGDFLTLSGDRSSAVSSGSPSSSAAAAVKDTAVPSTAPLEAMGAAAAEGSTAGPGESAATESGLNPCTVELGEAAGSLKTASAITTVGAQVGPAAPVEDDVEQAAQASEIRRGTSKLKSLASHRRQLLHAGGAAAAVDLLLLAGNALLRSTTNTEDAGSPFSSFTTTALGNYLLPLLRAVVMIYCLLSFKKFSLFPLVCRAVGAVGIRGSAAAFFRRSTSGASVFPSSPQGNAPGAAAALLSTGTSAAAPRQRGPAGATCDSHAVPVVFTEPAPNVKSAFNAAAASPVVPGGTLTAAAQRTAQPMERRSAEAAAAAAGKLLFAGHSCRSCCTPTDPISTENRQQQQPLLGYCDVEAGTPDAGTGRATAAAATRAAPLLSAGDGVYYSATDSVAVAPACRTAAGTETNLLVLAEAKTAVEAAKEVREAAAERAHTGKERNNLAFRLLLLCFLGGALRAINFQLPAAPSLQERGGSLLLLPVLLSGWPAWLQQQDQQLHVQQSQSQQHRRKASLRLRHRVETAPSGRSHTENLPYMSVRSRGPPVYPPEAAAAIPAPVAARAAPPLATAPFPAGASAAAVAARDASGEELPAGQDGVSGGEDAADFDGEGAPQAPFPASGFLDESAAAGPTSTAAAAAAAESFPAAAATPNTWRVLLLFLLLEVAWGVAAPFLDAFLLWRLQRCAAEERSMLHRCVLHATARYELLLRQHEEQQQREVWSSPEAGRWRSKREEGGVSADMVVAAVGTAGAADAGAAAGSLRRENETAAGEKQRCPLAAGAEEAATPRAAGQAATPSGGGPPTRAAGVVEEEEEDATEDDMDWFELLKLLRPFFWPSGRGAGDAEASASGATAAEDETAQEASIWQSPVVLRLLAVSTFFTIACSKALTLVSPLLIGAAAEAAAQAAAAAAAQQHDAAVEHGRRAARWVAAFAAASWGADFFKEAQSLAYVKVQQAASVEISARTLRHVLALHLEWHTKKQMGHVVRVIDRGTEGCASLMTYCIIYLGPVFVECIAVCLVFLFHMKHQVLASLLFLSVTVYAWVTLRVTFWRRKWREKQNRSDSAFHQLVVDALTNFETVKIFNAEDYEVRRYMTAVEEYQSVGTKIQTSLSFLNLSQRTVVSATLVGGLIFVSQAMTEGKMGVSEFVTAQMYFMNVFAPLNFLGTIYHVIVRSAIDARALCRLLRTEPGITDAPGALSLVDMLSVGPSPSSSSREGAAGLPQQQQGRAELPYAPAVGTAGAAGHADGAAGGGRSSSSRRRDKTAESSAFGEGASQHLLAAEAGLGDHSPASRAAAPPPAPAGRIIGGGRAMQAPRIDFVNVCFNYGGRRHAKGSLRNINLTVQPGTTCGLVGPSGSGKSTLMKLLLRLLEPRRGRVLINGVDIATVTQDSLRRCMGMVPQDAVMFNASMYANIVYANRQASFQDVEAAAEAAQLLPLIHSMKEGWETRVGERGLKLSGGERQRVAIARCLLRNPPVVLLDEATSSLDSLSEAAIQKALLQLSSSRTVLMIAHRLSTVMHADLICVMNDGVIVEQGTHAQLLAAGGAYADLWKAQARGETLRL